MYAAVAVLSLPLGLILLRAFSRSVIYPGAAAAFRAEGDLPRGVRLLRYVSADGTPLAGALSTSGKTDAPTVVLFHGNGESASQLVPVAEALQADGIDMFLPEYRGYGGIGGAATERRLCEDATAAREAIELAGVAPSRIVLAGRSLGTGVAVELATRTPWARLVLFSPYTSLVDVARGVVGPFAPLVMADSFDSLAKAGRLKGPVTIFHGTEDRVIPFELGRRLAASIEGARFVPLPSRGHNDLDLSALLRAEVGQAER